MLAFLQYYEILRTLFRSPFKARWICKSYYNSEALAAQEEIGEVCLRQVKK